MPRLALIAIGLLAGCSDGSDGARYLGDAGFRRARLEQSLVNPANGYSALRLARYATGDQNDWDRRPIWNPPVGGAAIDLSLPLPRLGEAAFFRYPAQLAPPQLPPDAPGIVTVQFSDGTSGRAMTCATCHARDGVVGAPNQTIDLGWGPGKIDVASPPGEEPVAIPDLRPVALEELLQRDGAVRNDRVALAIRIETLIVTSHGEVIRPPREVALGLADYLASLAPPVSGLDLGSAGGQFFSQRCAGCHVPPNLSGALIPLAEIGTDPNVGESRDRGTGGYRVPSLWGVGTRGRLLHDASVAGLEEMLDPARSVAGHRYGMDLTDGERAELTDFLRAL